MQLGPELQNLGKLRLHLQLARGVELLDVLPVLLELREARGRHVLVRAVRGPGHRQGAAGTRHTRVECVDLLHHQRTLLALCGVGALEPRLLLLELRGLREQRRVGRGGTLSLCARCCEQLRNRALALRTLLGDARDVRLDDAELCVDSIVNTRLQRSHRFLKLGRWTAELRMERR